MAARADALAAELRAYAWQSRSLPREESAPGLRDILAAGLRAAAQHERERALGIVASSNSLSEAARRIRG